MKKLFVLLMLVGMTYVLFSAVGTISTTDWGANYLAITQPAPNDAIGIPDGWVCEMLLPGADGVIDPPNTDGTPGGDDILPNGYPGNNWWEFAWDSSWTGVQGCHYGHGDWLWPGAGQGEDGGAYTINEGEDFYMRIFNAPDVASATMYLNSIIHTAPTSDGNLVYCLTSDWDYTRAGYNWQDINIPLAVTLTSFQAVMQGEFAAISWTTASEADLRNFNVYRNDVLIHQEDATNTSENTEYTFVDENVENGMTYTYNLEAVNLDGTTSNIGNVELTIEIDNPEEVVKTEFQNVYPNPVSVGVEQHIKLAVKTGETATMTIYNAKGQVVDTFDFNEGNHDYTFTPKFASGIYFYKLEGNNYSAVKKMLILK